MIDLKATQEAIKKASLDGWLIYDFRGSNPLVELIAGKKVWTTRRVYYFIPAKGEPTLLVNRLDASHTGALPGERLVYTDRHQLEDFLKKSLLKSVRRVAMEYSPLCELPVVSVIDGGTVEMIRSTGVEIVSSANIQQTVVAVWSDEAYKNHLVASKLVGGIKDKAFALIGRTLRSGGSLTDLDVQRFIMDQFAEEGLETDEPPVVATNQRSGDPHYVPTEATHYPIKSHDWVLIDLWARQPGESNIFSDITWVGVIGRDPSIREHDVFITVKQGRDKAIELMKEIHRSGRLAQGWEIDTATRKIISDKGFGEYFFHRTGHSLSPGKFVHGTGVNLDDYETHDTREIIPGVGWTVEPGIYLPEFGCRLEINGRMTAGGPEVTSVVQQDIIVES